MRVVIGFSTSDWWVSRAIRAFSRAPVSHTYICFDSDVGPFGHELFEAAWCGFRLSTRGKLTSGTTKIVREIPVPIEGMSALSTCRAWLETPYDYAGLLGEAWVMLGRWLGQRWQNPWANVHTLFCSEAATKLLQVSMPAVGVDSTWLARIRKLDARQVDPGELEGVLLQGLP